MFQYRNSSGMTGQPTGSEGFVSNDNDIIPYTRGYQVIKYNIVPPSSGVTSGPKSSDHSRAVGTYFVISCRPNTVS